MGIKLFKMNKRIESYNCSVADPDPDPNPDPDPPDPRVFGPPGSGSGSCSIGQRYGSWILLTLSKNSKKNLDFS